MDVYQKRLYREKAGYCSDDDDDDGDDDGDDDDHLLTRPTVGSSDSSWAAAKNANLANLEK